jgi:general secretion pathway protein E
VLAQRLARMLCPACKQPDTSLQPEMLAAQLAPWKLKGQPQPYKPVGCLECRNSGYRGRVGLYELMTVGDVGRNLIHPTVDADGLRRQAAVDGMIPLRVAGAMKVAEGVTTLDEVLRMTPAWESVTTAAAG